MNNSFRGFDLTERKRKIRRAMDLVPPQTPEDVPVIVHTPCYFGFGEAPRSPAYWEDPEEMLRFQQDGYEEHLRRVNDDIVPYFMPWFGTGVLASAFGCEIAMPSGRGGDPAVVSHAVRDVKDIARLKPPDPYKDGQMPVVLKFMEYAARNGELPVGYTDLNSPLCTAAQLCGYDKLFYWMYDEPEAVHELMGTITEAFIAWVRLQRTITGEAPGESNGLQGVWSPRGGVWLSDDDLVSVSAELYGEFVLPHYSRIFTEFGGGHLHFCGSGVHQIGNFSLMEGVTAINNSPLGNKEAFQALVRAVRGRLCIEIQDAAPLEPEPYYRRLFDGLDDLTGIMITSFAEHSLATDRDGRTIEVTRDPADNANSVVAAVRKIAAEMLPRQALKMKPEIC